MVLSMIEALVGFVPLGGTTLAKALGIAGWNRT
jgi:hypothetical protein